MGGSGAGRAPHHRWAAGGDLSHPENSKYINCCLIGIFRNDF
jgi:hypothetical protein